MSRQYRYELKFVVNDIKLSEIYQWLWSSTSMREAYPDRTINSLYFDDIKLRAVRDNIAGLPNREKFRFRWYSGDDDSVVRDIKLEKKVREGRLGYKETAPLTHLQDEFLERDIGYLKTASMEQFSKLGLYESSLEHDLFPTLHVNYKRQYLQDAEDIRMTIDSDIRFLHVNSCDKLFSSRPLDWSKKVIEFKFDPENKNKVASLIRPLHLVPQRCSKYLQGIAYGGMVKYQ